MYQFSTSVFGTDEVDEVRDAIRCEQRAPAQVLSQSGRQDQLGIDNPIPVIERHLDAVQGARSSHREGASDSGPMAGVVRAILPCYGTVFGCLPVNQPSSPWIRDQVNNALLEIRMVWSGGRSGWGQLRCRDL